MSDKFKAVTWNVYAGTPVRELRPILRNLREKKVSLYLMQEARDDKREIDEWLRAEGLETVNYKQYRLAWDPNVWVKVWAEGVRLSKTHFFAKDGDTPVHSEGARAILCDRWGRSLDTISYHTPAHVQGAEKKSDVPRRYLALVETMVELGDLADDSEARAVLYGGDDNWDEDTGFQTADLPTLLGRTTGLRQVQAGKPTHGSREIDDFRILRGGGIRPVGESWVQGGGGDHKVHGREFQWR